MLVVTRKQEQTIRIGANITVKVIKVGQTVKLGIDAPPDVRIVREELLERVIRFPEPEPVQGSNLRLASPLHHFLEDTFAGPIAFRGMVS